MSRCDFRWMLDGVAVLALAACGQNLDMTDQEKYRAWERGALFRNAQVVQTPVSGTVARGALDREKEFAQRPTLTLALLERGANGSISTARRVMAEWRTGRA